MARGEPQVKLLLRDDPSAMDRRWAPPWIDAPLSERLALALDEIIKPALRRYGLRWVMPLEWLPPADRGEGRKP